MSVRLAHVANEFDYRTHRKKHGKYYRRNLNRDCLNEDKLRLKPDNSKMCGDNTISFGFGNMIPAYEVANYLYGTDAWINAQTNPYNPDGYKTKHNVYEFQYNLSRSDNVETVFIPDTSDRTEAIASGDEAGNKPNPIIFNMNMTSPYMYGENSFYLIGQDDGVNDGDQIFYARVRLLYSNDPLFQFVPVDSIAQVFLCCTTFVFII
jgi:hypothetical protein